MSIQIDDYIFSPTEENKLGQGTYAVVYKGFHRLTKKFVAVKVINFDGRTPQDQHYLTQEINLMKEIDHPNIIKFYSMKKMGPNIYLVLEFCSGKDLKALLDKQPNKRLDEDTSRHFMCQIASGLRYLHEKGIIHRDLKPHNLLLSECTFTADLKICDFGFARKIEPQMMSILGSPLYMAPEILCGRPYSSKSDLWSVGCIFYEMLMGHTPLAPLSMAHLRQLAADGRPVTNFPVTVSPLCKELLEGLLQKKNNQRYDWKQFLEHQYLTPENLSRSMLIKPENPQPNNIMDCRWLQRVYNFYPSAEHTLYVKPGNLISEVKAILSKLVGASVNDLLLFDMSGKLLMDNLNLNYYQFQQRDQPIFVITRTFLMDSNENIPPYQFKYDLPFNSLTVPVTPELPLEATTMSRLNAIHDNWGEKEEYLKSLYKNIKMREVNVITCKSQYENQLSIYKVLRSHVVARASELSKAFQPVEDLFLKQKTIVEHLIKTPDGVLAELKDTVIHDGLRHIAKVQNLLDLVDGRKFLTDCSRLRDEFSTLTNQINVARDSVQKSKEEIDSLVRSKLDENQYTQIIATTTKMTEIINESRNSLNIYKDRYKQTNKNVQTLRLAGSKRTDSETEQALKNPNYLELSKIFSFVSTFEDNSSNLVTTCKQAMVKATQMMVSHIQAMGKVLFHTERVLASVQFVRTQLSQLLPVIDFCKKISKLRETYIECLKEIQRRREYQQKVETIYNFWKDHFNKNIYDNELKKRFAFRQLYSEDLMPQLTPFFIKNSEIDEKNSIPSLQLILQPNENLPQINQLPVSLEDDFLVMTIEEYSNPAETLKMLRQENSKLLELLNNLQKQETERKTNVLVQIVELQEEIATLKKNQKPVIPVPDPSLLAIKDSQIFKLQEEISALKKEQLKPLQNPDAISFQNLKEEMNTCKTEIQKMQTEIQSLKTKNQTLLTKLNEKQVTQTLNPEQSIEALNQQISDLKVKVADGEIRIVQLASGDIQRLQEMGFPLELAKEAMLSNKNVQDATNWLLEHSKIQPKV